jgi:hypothetical protein
MAMNYIDEVGGYVEFPDKFVPTGTKNFGHTMFVNVDDQTKYDFVSGRGLVPHIDGVDPTIFTQTIDIAAEYARSPTTFQVRGGASIPRANTHSNYVFHTSDKRSQNYDGFEENFSTGIQTASPVISTTPSPDLKKYIPLVGLVALLYLFSR